MENQMKMIFAVPVAAVLFVVAVYLAVGPAMLSAVQNLTHVLGA
jgi:hypothetical protein